MRPALAIACHTISVPHANSDEFYSPWQIVAKCEVQCKTIIDLVDQNLLGIQREHFVDSKQQTKSTVCKQLTE